MIWKFVPLWFYEISVELTIFRLQYSASDFGNPPLWTSLCRFGNGYKETRVKPGLHIVVKIAKHLALRPNTQYAISNVLSYSFQQCGLLNPLHR